MWIRMRFDIGWTDLAAGLAYCLAVGDRSAVAQQTERAWNDRHDILVTLSVRSAFDLMLRAIHLPHGSEVLLSALTVPDMVHLVRLHGLTPVPIDTDQFGNVTSSSVRRSLSSKSRIIVIAHLFGSRVPLDDIVEIARERNLLVVEDCAQGFCEVGDSGDPSSDLAMFSFGPIKTASALGGAVVRVSNPELRQNMATLLHSDPIQKRSTFVRRIVRFGLLKSISGCWGAGLFRRCVMSLGYNFDSLANGLARGFASADLLKQIRRQPTVPLLLLMRRRWRGYDFARIRRRIDLGRQLDDLIGQEHSRSHTYWAFPLFVRNPAILRDSLSQAGFDATCQSRMTVVPAIDESRVPTEALAFWEHVLFLPWYSELSDDAVCKLADLLRSADLLGGVDDL